MAVKVKLQVRRRLGTKRWLRMNIETIKMYPKFHKRLKMYIKLPKMYLRNDLYLPPMFNAEWDDEKGTWIRKGAK